MNIITSICVDEDKSDENINYPATLKANAEQRRLIYWKCVVVFMATSVRCNPNYKHIVFTNDTKPVTTKNIEVKSFLESLGVIIKILPFKEFKPPPGYSKNFKNAFYKLDVMKALGEFPEDQYSIVVDSDCVWVKPEHNLLEIMKQNKVLLYDVYRSFKVKKGKYHEVRLKMGKLYKEIDSSYPVIEPIQFGGEIVGASSNNFKIITTQMQDVFKKILSIYHDQPLRLDENRKILDGMEMLTSYIYNIMNIEKHDLQEHIARIWNTLRSSTASEANMDLTIWHMPSEKTQSFPLLFNKVIDRQSKFWTVPLSRFKFYLGSYLGVPKQFVPKRYVMLIGKVLQSIKRNYK